MTEQRTWSPQQRAVFDFFVDGAGHGVVEAYAGTGKTTTLVEAINRVPATSRVLVCAFNKSIQQEVASRLRAGADCKTLHSLGYAALMRAWGHTRPVDKRSREIVRGVLPEHLDDDEIEGDVLRLFGLAMNTLTTDAAGLRDLLYDFELGNADEDTEDLYVEWTLKALDVARTKHPEISFDQMVYVPAALDLRTGRYDFVVVDECQDMSRAQIKLAKNALKEGGRFVGVGDARQAIYAFRGADCRSLANIVAEMGASKLKLSTTYRCPRRVVAHAQRFVPDFTAAPEAPEGAVVEGVAEAAFLRDVRGGDVVLSRKNAPLARYCLKVLALGRPAYILGREIGAGLQAFVRKSKRRAVPDFLRWLAEWRDGEVRRLARLDDAGARLDAVNDKYEALVTLSEGLTTVEELVHRLGKLFEAGEREGGVDRRICFSSVHKFKGQERQRVWCLMNTFREGHSEEEDNLCYVAFTRAKSTLMLVDAPPKRR